MVEIESRIAKLEALVRYQDRILRRWRDTFILGGAVAIVVLLMGAAETPGPLRATSLDIVDRHGVTRAQLALANNGTTPQLLLKGDSDDTYAAMYVGQDGPILQLTTHPETGVLLAATATDATGGFIGAASREIMFIGNNENGAALTILHENGKLETFPAR